MSNKPFESEDGDGGFGAVGQQSGGGRASAGGASGGAMITGGAPGRGGRRGSGGSSDGGAVSMGGNPAFGGAISFGGASGAPFGGASGASFGGMQGVDPVTEKYCTYYCDQSFAACLDGTAGASGECAGKCIRRGAMLSDECRTAYQEALLCTAQSIAPNPTCEGMVIGAEKNCLTQLPALQACGESLPGADNCSLETIGAESVCLRVQQCNAVMYYANCQVSSMHAYCSCFVNGSLAYNVVRPTNATACEMTAALGCGPSLVVQ